MAAQTVKATTLARVKALGKFADSEDAELQTVLDAVSVEIEEYLEREFESKSRTERQSLRPGERSVWLNAIPITSITTVKHSLDWTHSDDDPLEAAEYEFDPDTGRLFFGQRFLASLTFNPQGFRALEIVYVGGMATTTANLITDFPAVALAADMQIGEDYRRRFSLGTSSRPGPAGGTQYEGKSRFLPRVQELLAPHRRTVFV